MEGKKCARLYIQVNATIKFTPFKLRPSGFRIQWETLLEWRLPSLTKLKWCRFPSHSRTWLAWLEVFIMVFAVQVRFKTTQVESGEVWALCLVRLWPRKNSTASVWWYLWGIQKIFKVRRAKSQLLTTLSQNLNFRKLVKTGPVEYIAPETKEVRSHVRLKVIKFTSFWLQFRCGFAIASKPTIDLFAMEVTEARRFRTTDLTTDRNSGSHGRRN